MRQIYRFISGTVFLIVFLGAWVYCTNEYGFLLGFGLGWLPAALSATVAALLWPLGVLIGAGVGGLIAYENHFKKPSTQTSLPSTPTTQPAAPPSQQPPKRYMPQVATDRGWEDVKTPPAPATQADVDDSFDALNQSFWNAYHSRDGAKANRLGIELYARVEKALAKAMAAGDVEAVNEINLFRSRLEAALRSIQSGGG